MVDNTETNTMVEDRIAAVEARANTFEARLRRLEGAPPARAVHTEALRAARRGRGHDGGGRAPLPAGHSPVAAVPPAPRLAARRQLDLEDFLGGSVLAWLGGTAVV